MSHNPSFATSVVAMYLVSVNDNPIVVFFFVLHDIVPLANIKTIPEVEWCREVPCVSSIRAGALGPWTRGALRREKSISSV